MQILIGEGGRLMVPSKEWLDWASLIGGLGSGIAGVGAVAAFWQLRLLKTQSVTSFEDGLVDECSTATACAAAS